MEVSHCVHASPFASERLAFEIFPARRGVKTLWSFG
jgi:hypothetical protein